MQEDEIIEDDRRFDVILRPNPDGRSYSMKARSFRLSSGPEAAFRIKDPAAQSVLLRRVVSTHYHPWLDSEARPRRILLNSLATVVFGFFVFFQVAGIPQTFMDFVVVAGIAILSFVGSYCWMWWSGRKWVQAWELLDRLPAHCAGCWYPLGGLPESDDCSVCPECGAAWRVAPVGDTE